MEFDRIKKICKIGEGCCRYLIVGKGGFECAHSTPLAKELDARAENKMMTATAINCEGHKEQSENAGI